MKTIATEDLDGAFAECVRDAEAGEKVVFTRDGHPVATISPVASRRVLTPEQEAAAARIRARMEKGWPIGAGPLNRDELYER